MLTEQQTALHLACETLNVAAVELLANSTVDLDVQDRIGDNALMKAARKGSLECLEILLYAGADTSRCDNFGRTAVIHAIQNNNKSCALALLDFICEENINFMLHPCATTVLMEASRNNNKDLIEELLSRGADPHLFNFEKPFAVDFTSDHNCAEILLKTMHRECSVYLKRNADLYIRKPINIVKLHCEIVPKLFASAAIEYIFESWERHKEDCIHILQILLSQISLDSEAGYYEDWINIPNSQRLVYLLEIIETLLSYGQDVAAYLWKYERNSKPHCLSIRIYCCFSFDVSSLQKLAKISPTFSPHNVINDKKFTSCNKSQIEAQTSWELELDENGSITKRVHSLKHIIRCRLREIFCECGLTSCRDFRNGLEQLNLPECLQMYLKYQE